MRRKRNKKRKVQGFAYAGPTVGLVILVLVALAYVWLGGRCKMIGKDITDLEMKKEELSKRYAYELYHWTQLQSPRNMEKALAKWKLNLVWPSSSQIQQINDISAKDVEKIVSGEYYPAIAKR